MKHQRKKAFSHEKGSPGWWQEIHSPTEPVQVKMGHAGRITLSKTHQRKADRRIIDGLDESQRNAMDDINYGFSYVTRGLGSKISGYEKERVQGSGPNTDKGEELYFWYRQWARQGQRRFNVKAVMSIVASGLSLRRVAVLHRTGQRWPKTNLVDGLDAYCKLRRAGGRSY